MTIRVLLADDHVITREGVKSLLWGEQGIQVVAETDNGRDAVAMAMDLVPDVVIMDINMPGLNGIEACRRILNQQPQIKVVALSMFSERRYVAGMLRAGASGYLLKSCAFNELLDAVHSVVEGHRYVSREITDVVMEEMAGGGPARGTAPAESLTAREREVLQLIAEGKTSVQVAAGLHVSEKTVSTHRRKIMTKLDIHTVAGLTKFAVREGMISLVD